MTGGDRRSNAPVRSWRVSTTRGTTIAPETHPEDGHGAGAPQVSPDDPYGAEPPGAQPHVPTSEVLAALVDALPGERVSLDWLVTHLHERSFGIVLLLMALIALVPGASAVFAVLMVIPAVQMILARPRPVLPRFVARREISAARLAWLVQRVSPSLRLFERVIRPRWHTPFETTKRALGVTILLLGISVLSPVPLFHIPPLIAIMLISLAFLEKDGVLLALSLVAALVSLAVTAGTVWGAIATGDWLDRIL